MDKNLRKYINTVLVERRLDKLDELDEALTSKTASREFVETKLKDYRDALVAMLMFTDWEDGLNTTAENKTE